MSSAVQRWWWWQGGRELSTGPTAWRQGAEKIMLSVLTAWIYFDVDIWISTPTACWGSISCRQWLFSPSPRGTGCIFLLCCCRPWPSEPLATWCCASCHYLLIPTHALRGPWICGIQEAWWMSCGSRIEAWMEPHSWYMYTNSILRAGSIPVLVWWSIQYVKLRVTKPYRSSAHISPWAYMRNNAVWG